MENKLNTLQGPLILLCLLVFMWSCKETKSESAPITQEIATPKPISKELTEVLDFADITASQEKELIELIGLFETKGSDVVQSINADEMTARLKQMKTSKKVENYPIIEIRGTDHVVLMLQGRGFGGPIWGKLLLNRKTMVFEKIQFDHKSESEGYGDAMTYSSFEDQFMQKRMLPETAGFQLHVKRKNVEPGFYSVDGISGATISSEAVIDMMNSGLAVYHAYLFPKPQ